MFEAVEVVVRGLTFHGLLLRSTTLLGNHTVKEGVGRISSTSTSTEDRQSGQWKEVSRYNLRSRPTLGTTRHLLHGYG